MAAVGGLVVGAALLSSVVVGKSADPNFYVPQALLDKDLTGKTAIVTGATGSFGAIVSETLVKQGAHVVLAVRRLDAGMALAVEINAKGYRGEASAMCIDLSDLTSISNFVENFTSKHASLHILVENAAICAAPNVPVSGTRFEPHLASNHFGHLFLRHHLEPVLSASSPSRIVVVASCLHDRMFTKEPVTLDLNAGDAAYLGFTNDPNIDTVTQWMAYSRSKLCNVLSALAASKRLGAKGITIVSLHPGTDSSTGLFRNSGRMLKSFMWIFGRFVGTQTTNQSVQTILYCCLEDEGKLENGAYYSQWYKSGYRDGQTGGWPMKSPNPLVTPENALKLEEMSYKALGLAAPKNMSL